MENNELLEEEVEIISVFLKELKEYGHDGYCSFYEDVLNGYSIYKEDNYWVVNFNNKGKTIVSKKYTNIYNLCLDILDEMKVDDFYFQRRDLKIPRGTRVVITESTDCPIDELKMGVVVTSHLEKVEQRSPERVYQVFGDDGRLYGGLYGLRFYGDTCFRTMEDYIKDVERERRENMETVEELIETNGELYFTLQEVLGEKDRYLGESMFTK